MATDGTVLPKVEKPARRPQLLRNTLANWAGEAVFVLSGFVLPRLINDYMGAAELGVWDFGWSMRTLIARGALGMGSSAGFHVARLRVLGDIDELSKMLSATLALVLYSNVIGLIITAAIIYFVPTMMSAESPALITSAQAMVGAMGIAVAVQMAANVYGAVLVGSHRFVLLNSLHIVADFLLVLGVMAAVLFKWGLVTMAVCVATREVIDFLATRWAALRLYPELRLRLRWTDRERFKEIATYGAKTLTDNVASLVINQGIVTIVMTYYSSATLALFMRPLALIRNATRFVMGYTRTLVPRASELHAHGKREELGRLLVDGTRHSLFLVMPIVVFLIIMGRVVLGVWMGAGYEDPTLLIILFVAYLPFLAQRSTWHVLFGIGAHGFISIAWLVTAFLSLGLAMVLIGVFQMKLTGAALALGIPTALFNLTLMPFAACRVSGLSMAAYWKKSALRPLLMNLPLAAALTAVRLAIGDEGLLALTVATVVGSVVLLYNYWRGGLLNRLLRR